MKVDTLVSLISLHGSLPVNLEPELQVFSQQAFYNFIPLTLFLALVSQTRNHE